MDKDKLAQFRKKSVENKAKKHKELLDSTASIKEAVLALHEAINKQQPYDDTKLVEQLKELKASLTFTDDITRLETALKASSNENKLDDLIEAVGSINNKDVVSAVNELVQKLDDNTIDQEPEDYRPFRRVIKLGERYVFDDNPTPANSGGGGGGVQSNLLRAADGGRAIAVVNPDGTNIGGGGDVNVGNFPSEYPLPDDQVTALTPQTDGLTNSELRATPLNVNVAQTNYTTRIEEDSVDSNLTYIGNAAIGTAENASLWQIKRLDSTTGLIKLWRDGDDLFNNQWSTREAGSYS